MTAVLTCGRSECEVSKTGICSEGHTPPESCPSFGQAISDIVVKLAEDHNAEDSNVLQDKKTSRVSLPSGEALVLDEIDQFLLWKPIKFVTIVGDFDSGKTTLISSLYERFLRGKFAGYLFGGSRTLVGFEKRAHHSRVDSGRASPDTLRTSFSDGLRYFHLSLMRDGDTLPGIELMLSDRAGEQYLKARNNSELINELIEVKKAQHVVVLLDGARLADPMQRHSAMQAVRQTLQAFLDNGALSNLSRVQVVTTKIDLLKKIPQLEILNTQLGDFRTRLLRDFGKLLAELSFWEIAARSQSGEFSAAYGIDDLLASWCASIPPVVTRTQFRTKLTNEFDRLLSRTPTLREEIL